MSNTYFRFPHFTINQEHCAMKVSTDGVLLASWAQCPTDLAQQGAEVEDGPRALDIGTGTALLALFLAQRYANCRVTAIEIDSEAAEQANENVAQSPYAERISVEHISLQDFLARHKATLRNEAHNSPTLTNKTLAGEFTNSPTLFDAIVCNPPYFQQALLGPNDQRNTARHTTSLTFAELCEAAKILLAPQGLFSLILPADSLPHFQQQADRVGLRLTRQLNIRTAQHKPVTRHLLEYQHATNSPCIPTINELTINSPEHKQLITHT